MTRVTLMDVARHCGVSRATVSLVLNDSPLVAEKTRDRVRKAMTELGMSTTEPPHRCVPSAVTRSAWSSPIITNPYFAEFATGLQDVLTEQRHRAAAGRQQ